MNKYMAVWFVLGLVWAWGLIAIVGVLIGYNKDVSDMWRDEIYTEYEKYFSPEEIEILKRIIYNEVDIEIYKEKLIDFFNENTCPSEDLIDIVDYNHCSDGDLLERLITDLGA
jgi:hypothetical protein